MATENHNDMYDNATNDNAANDNNMNNNKMNSNEMNNVYQQYAQSVYRFLLSKTRNEDLAEELTQETFCQAIKSIDRFDGSCKLSTWLFGIAKNQWYNYTRKHPQMQDISEYQDELKSDDSAEDVVLKSLKRVELVSMLHNCPEPYREVLYQRIFGNLSFREIGEVLGKTENWARVTYYRGKQQLKERLTIKSQVEK